MQTRDHLQLEVMNFFWRHIQFPSQEGQKCWVVVFLNARGSSRLVARVIFIEPVRDLAEDWNELRFLVELEVFVNVPVDLSVRESQHEGNSTCWFSYDESPRWESEAGVG